LCLVVARDSSKHLLHHWRVLQRLDRLAGEKHWDTGHADWEVADVRVEGRRLRLEAVRYNLHPTRKLQMAYYARQIGPALLHSFSATQHGTGTQQIMHHFTSQASPEQDLMYGHHLSSKSPSVHAK
jgi:hypothetical protein